MKLVLENVEKNDVTTAYKGFNWLLLLAIIFLGNISSITLVRRQYRLTAILYIFYIIMIVLLFSDLRTSMGISAIIILYVYLGSLLFLLFRYNSLHLNYLLKHGYKFIKVPDNYKVSEDVTVFHNTTRSDQEIDDILKLQFKKKIIFSSLFIIFQVVSVQVILYFLR